MKQSDNTGEMDILLQRHARRAAAGAFMGRGVSESGGGSTGVNTSVHLDADEMNAYAEGALPDAARSRYVAHLADCDVCRRIVTDLTLAANVATEASQPTTSPDVSSSKSWWQAITGLFTLPVLRYAVPAILLFGVILVALVATRKQTAPQFVAKNEPDQSQTVQTKEETGASNSSAATASNTSAGEANTSNSPLPGITSPAEPAVSPPSDYDVQANLNTAQTSPEQGKTVPLPAPVMAPGQNAPTREQEQRRDEGYGEDSTGQPAPAEASPAPPASAAKEKVEDTREERARNEAPTTTTDTASGRRSKDTEPDDNAALASKAPMGRTEAKQNDQKRKARRIATPGSTAGGANVNDGLSNSIETRSVGGRNFRKQGGAWIDTAYNSSRSTINVARGSDQYRALVADEPGIDKIAKQLGGEVIIVWKSKAYRIY